MQRRHLESGSLLEGLLNLDQLLLLGEFGVVVHLFVLAQGGGDHSSHGAALVGTKFLGLGDVAGGESSLDVGNKLGDVTLATGLAQGDPTLDGEHDHGEEEGLKDRHDETALVDGSKQVQRSVGVVAILEVAAATKHKVEETLGQNEADEDHPRCILDTTDTAVHRLLSRGLRVLNFCLFSHNCSKKFLKS